MLRLVVVRASAEEAVRRDWTRFLTADELAYAGSRQRTEEHVAARIAARQAILDLLGWDSEPPWHDVEIVRSHSGRPSVRLRGEVDRIRSADGLPLPGVSVSHAAGFAAALAWLPGQELRT